MATKGTDGGGRRFGRSRGGGAASGDANAGKAAKAGKPPKQPKTKRTAQIRATYAMARRVDPRIGLIVAATGLGVFLCFLLVGFLVGHPIYVGIMGLFSAVAAMAVVFGRRAERAAYSQVEGQPGAAAGVLQSIRRGWTVTPAVAVNRNQDLVHRAVGRPGVVLVGEGVPSRVETLLVQEKKKLTRMLPEVAIHTLQAGTHDGQIPLRRLQRELLKLPRTLRPAQVAEVDRRLKAMGGLTLPVPKGPMPKNLRMPRGPRG